MEPNPPDTDRLARSIEEPRAFEVLFDRHFGAVHAYLHRRAGRNIADDRLQRTLGITI